MKTWFSWGFAAGLMAVALLAGTADAQERQGGRGRGFGMFGPNLIFLAGNEAVQKEIGADEATVAKIETLGGEFRTSLQEEMSGVRGGANFQDMSDDERQQFVAKIRAAAAKVNDQFEPKLKEALSADQFQRLLGIFAQVPGTDALANSLVAKELGLSEEQTKKIADIRADYRQKQSALGRDAEPNARGELRQEETKKATEVLTAEQQEKLTALKGKEFDVSQLRPGRGDGQGDGNRRRRPQSEN